MDPLCADRQCPSRGGAVERTTCLPEAALHRQQVPRWLAEGGWFFPPTRDEVRRYEKRQYYDKHPDGGPLWYP